MPPERASEATSKPGLGTGPILLFSLAAAVAVGNLYYVQPLLNEIGREFAVSDGTSGLLVTVTQIGYLAGLALIVPAGDMFDRHRLISWMFGACALAALCCAAAPGFVALAVALVALGVLAVVAQVVLPYAAALASPEQRGEVVGRILGGALVGILLARAASGLVAEAGGWRLVYVCAAAMMAALGLFLHRLLPAETAAPGGSYRGNLRSVFRLVTEEPVLRQRIALGACIYACFSLLWTALTFLLGSAPYEYGEGTIGVFGFAGLAGIVIAPISGRFVDRGHVRLATTLFLCALVASWALLLAGRSSLVPLVIGVVVLDMAVQGAHINNQATIYGLRSGAGGRLITGYQVSIFTGLIVGSALAALSYELAGWPAVCGLGAAFAVLALAIWARTGGAPRGSEQLAEGSERGQDEDAVSAVPPFD